jgi:hypothetical protein
MWEHEQGLIEEARRAQMGYGRTRTKRHVIAEVAAVVALVYCATIAFSYLDKKATVPQVKVEYVSKIEQDKLQARRNWKEQLCAHYAAWIKSTGQSVNPMEKGCQ